MPANQFRSDDFRDRLITARNRSGLSIEAMSLLLLTSLAQYQRWESGIASVPGIAVAAAELLAEKLAKRRLARDAQVSPVIDKIASLADGTRTAREIAAIVERTPRYISHIVSVLRARGGPAQLSNKSGNRAEYRERRERIVADLANGLTLAETAKKYKVCYSTVYRLEKLRERQESAAE